jgi:hypothetical protein
MSLNLGFSYTLPSTGGGEGGSTYPKVDTYNNLPLASEHTDDIYVVRQTTGIWILGTQKVKGMYRSTGSAWDYLANDAELTSLTDGTITVVGSPILLEAGANMGIIADSANNKITLTSTSGNGGANGSNLYYTTTPSDVGGYYVISSNLPVAETELSTTVTNQELLVRTYLFPQEIATEIIDAGAWRFSTTAKVSSAVGVTQLKAEVFLRHTNGTETTLFSGYSAELNNTNYSVITTELLEQSVACSTTDRLGLRFYAKTTSNAPITINTVVGDGRASYFVTPLKLRHSQLRELNSDNNYLHVTSTEKTTWNNKVDSVAGKGLSTNDYTTAEQTKLSGIEASADNSKNKAMNILTAGAGATEYVLQRNVQTNILGTLPSGVNSTITLPTPVVGYENESVVHFNTGGVVPTLVYNGFTPKWQNNGYAGILLNANSHFTIVFEQVRINTSTWIVKASWGEHY